jgi:rhamnopyranosyl-N-acetylglucosaminyl-diphospho-decaprenol beta-1,3/1,4-galactofuranosyltransferase
MAALSSAPQIAAVVVTYNRKNLLARCLEAIFAQTRPVDRVIVVDNCSTDGTPEFLAERGYLSNAALDYLQLCQNMGGAGGFHEGMKRAYEQGYDWIWLMDDDGVPLPDTLVRLLECPAHVLFRGCLVLSSEDPTREQLAFGLIISGGAVSVRSELKGLDATQGILEGIATPFNGVLISRTVVQQIGLPKKEMYLWGDEMEYFLRAQKSRVPIAMVPGAMFLHPPDRMRHRRVRVGPLSFSLPYSDDPFRFYLIVRNYTYISLRYHGPLSKKSLKLMAYPFLFPGRIRLILRGWSEVMRGRLVGGDVLLPRLAQAQVRPSS